MCSEPHNARVAVSARLHPALIVELERVDRLYECHEGVGIHPPPPEPNARGGLRRPPGFLAQLEAPAYGRGALGGVRMKARPATLVVIEFGASWPRWLNPTGDRGDLAVVAQHYAGPPTDLITQVAMRVTRLQARGWQLSAMSWFRTDAPTHQRPRRAPSWRAGCSHTSPGSGGGSFALSVDGYLGRRAEHNLSALAAALEPIALTSRVELRVETAASSGTGLHVAAALTA